MASFVQEKKSFINNEEGLNPEIPQRDDTLLMSFLEDSVQLEFCDDERLLSLIQSLEAAIINPNLINDHGSLDDGYQLQDCLFDQLMSNDEKHMYHGDQDNCASHDLDFSWMDGEMSSSSSPTYNNISCRYEQDGEDDVGYYSMAQYGGVIDNSEIPLEEHIYSSIWQETYSL